MSTAPEPEDVDWGVLSSKLPYGKTPIAAKRRKELWDKLDVNGNGYLSLAEIDKGMQQELCLDQLFRAKPVMMRAFEAARQARQSKATLGADFVERADIPVVFEQYVRMAPSERLRLGLSRREAFARRFDAVRIFERAGIGSLLRASSS